jgi:hypothetical protein
VEKNTKETPRYLRQIWTKRGELFQGTKLFHIGGLVLSWGDSLEASLVGRMTLELDSVCDVEEFCGGK